MNSYSIKTITKEHIPNESDKHNNISFIMHIITLFVIPCIVAVITLLDIRGGLRDFSLVISLLLFVFTNVDNQLTLLFFLMPYSADIQFSILGIPFMTVLQISYVIRFFYKTKWRLEKNTLLFVIAITVLQLYSIAFCGENFIRLLTFILNIMLFNCISHLQIDYSTLHKLYWFYAFGLLIALIAGVIRSSGFSDLSYVRFQGIWTDPNFLGMFCVMSIVFLYRIMKVEKKIIWIAIPIMFFYIYCGYRTYSKTFSVAIAISLGLIVFELLKNNTNLIIKICSAGVALISFIIVLRNYVTAIFTLRGDLFSAGIDWTNGRVGDIGTAIGKWTSDFGNILFGYGINNSYYYAAVAHNTYVELVVQLGIIGSLVFVVYLISIIVSNHICINKLKDTNTLSLIVILIYGTSLSLETTDLVYYSLGLIIAEYQLHNTYNNMCCN